MADERLPENPRSFFRLPNSLPSLWEEMEGRMSQWMGAGNETGISVSEDAQNVYIEAQLPGVSPDDLDVSIHRNTLIVKGEKKEEQIDKNRKFYRRAKNSFFYQVELPAPVEEESEEAHYQDGALKLTFKKSQPIQIKKIAVRQGQENQKTNGSKISKKDKDMPQGS